MSVPGAAPGTKRVKPQSLVQEKPDSKASVAQSGSRKPDRAAHDVEVKTIEAEIDSVKSKNDQLRAKISAGGSNGSVNEERQKIRDELNSLRNAQAGMKANRGKTQEQIRNMQERMQSKIKDLNAARGKFPYKSGSEVDSKIASLEKQVESGNLKLVDERKTLNEISTLRKSRKTVDGFAAQQTAIEEDRKAIDAAKAKLDDPEAKAASDKYNDLKSQLDKLTDQADEAYKGRSKLYEQRDAYKKQLDDLYGKRRELKDNFRAANDAYFQKMNEERTRRAEKQKAEKAALDDAKRKEINEQLLEEASQPAFEREIEDCSTLIEYFSRGGGKSSVPAPKLSTAGDNAPKVPAHEIRKVDAIPEGATVLKKKGDEEEGGFFGGMGGGKKGKKGRKAAPSEETNGTSAGIQLPMSTLSALLALEVPSPITSQDIPKTIEALQEKQKWYKENQAKTTEERVAAAKARIERATKAVESKSGSSNGKTSSKKTETASAPPPLEHRGSAEPMQIGDKDASDAAQADATEDSNDGEPTATVNGAGESLDVTQAES